MKNINILTFLVIFLTLIGSSINFVYANPSTSYVISIHTDALRADGYNGGAHVIGSGEFANKLQSGLNSTASKYSIIRKPGTGQTAVNQENKTLSSAKNGGIQNSALIEVGAHSDLLDKYGTPTGVANSPYVNDLINNVIAPNVQGNGKIIIPMDHTKKNIPDTTGGNTFAGSNQRGAATYKNYTERDVTDAIAAKIKAKFGDRVVIVKPEDYKSYQEYDETIVKTGGGNSSSSSSTATESTATSSTASTTAGTVSYQSYTNFPGVGRIGSLCQLITALWLVGFAVLLTSVLGMFLWGGYIYVTAGVNAGKVNQAKEIFTNTITGLIIGLSIFIIINIINPGLLQGNCSIPAMGSTGTGTGAGQPTLGGENVLCNVNPNHPWLQKLGSATLNTGPTGSCVTTTLNNMERLGVPNFSGGTDDDPNNSRGAMVRLVKTGNWTSCALPGSTNKTISSSYGSIQAAVINADAYETLAKNGQIPSGAIIFQTRHGWQYGGGASGNDMGIVRNGGRITHNYASMSPIIYGDAKEVVILIPSK